MNLKIPHKFNGRVAAHVFLALGAAAATLMVFVLTPDFPNEIIGHAAAHPQVVLFEFLIALIAVYLFYFATGRVWLGVGIPALAMFVFCAINKYKVYLRGDPFMPADIILGVEVQKIASASSLTIGVGTIALLGMIVLGSAALALLFRFGKPRVLTRAVGGLVCAALAAAAFFGVCINNAVYDSIPIKHNRYNMVNEFNSKGFFLAFFHHIRDLNLGALRPEGYSERRALEILAEYGAVKRGGAVGVSAGAENGIDAAGEGMFRPDVIFLMSEAFWDITQIPTLRFDGADGADGADDPIPNYHSLEKAGIAGDFYSNVYGGGTDTTEFNVLTGHSLANFDREISSAYKSLVRRDTDSIVRTFRRAGYSTAALHPGFEWFYNRVNVYPWFGFERLSFSRDFSEAEDISGNYISDAAMTDHMIELYDGHTATGGDPYFLFTVSIQNHGPYDGGYMYGELPRNYATASGVSLSTKGDYAVTNFVRGLRDADAALGRLVDTYEDAERPLVLVFFGDHLPGLGYNYSTYRELGWPIGPGGDLKSAANVYRGRYLIWANREARARWPEYETQKERSRRMSASYLGAYVTEILGIGGPYERLVNGLYERLPVYHAMFYGTDGGAGAPLFEGSPGDSDNADLMSALSEYKIVQYYKLFDERIEAK